MEDINFELAEKLGYKRPKSPFEKNIDSIRKVSEGLKKEETISFIAGFVNQYEKTYLIYSNGNIVQFSADIKVAKLNGNAIENKIAYYYLDGINLYFICAVDYLNIFEINSVKPNKGDKAKIIIPPNYLINLQKNYYRIDDYGNKIENKEGKLDAENRYSLENDISSNSKFFVEGKPFSLGKDGNKITHTIQEYTVKNNPTIIIRIKDEISVNLKNGKFISHKFESTNRRYTNPDVFAGYVGVLFEMLNYKVICHGSCFKDGSGYPSITHLNGKSFDIQKKSNEPTVKLTDDEVNLVKAFSKFHFRLLYTNKTCKVQLTNMLTGMTIKDIPGHDDHLHFGEFDSGKIVQKKQIFINEPRSQMRKV